MEAADFQDTDGRSVRRVNGTHGILTAERELKGERNPEWNCYSGIEVGSAGPPHPYWTYPLI